MSKLIHVAKAKEGYYFLKEIEPAKYEWFLNHEETGVAAASVQNAMRIGYKSFATNGFSPLPCGNKQTLPERDEHGSPALFMDMVQSLASSNGIYFDGDLGHNCIVNQIPTATRSKIPEINSSFSSD